MEKNIRTAVECYAPLYSHDEFNQNLNTDIDKDTYQTLIQELGVSTKEDTLETAREYGRTTERLFISSVKEIADEKYLSGVFRT